MKNNSSILSVISLCLSVGIILVWIFSNFKLEIIDLSTFIGASVGLIAIIVTFAVGYQIYNSLEFKSVVNDIINKNEQKAKEIEALKSDFVKYMLINQVNNNYEFVKGIDSYDIPKYCITYIFTALEKRLQFIDYEVTIDEKFEYLGNSLFKTEIIPYNWIITKLSTTILAAIDKYDDNLALQVPDHILFLIEKTQIKNNKNYNQCRSIIERLEYYSIILNKLCLKNNSNNMFIEIGRAHV